MLYDNTHHVTNTTLLKLNQLKMETLMQTAYSLNVPSINYHFLQAASEGEGRIKKTKRKENKKIVFVILFRNCKFIFILQYCSLILFIGDNFQANLLQQIPEITH